MYAPTYQQGQEFEKEICPCTKILYFDVSDETMTARLINRGKSSGRTSVKLKNPRPLFGSFSANALSI